MRFITHYTLIIVLLSLGAGGAYSDSWNSMSPQTEESLPETSEENVILGKVHRVVKLTLAGVRFSTTTATIKSHASAPSNSPIPQSDLFLRYRSLLL